MKICRTCGILKDFAAFNYDRSRDYYPPTCRFCYKTRNPRGHIKGSKGDYRMSAEGYATTLASQGGVCAICGMPEQKKHKNTDTLYGLSVDHDHVSGATRALLCSFCNFGLGHFSDDPTRLRRAAEYLESWA